MHREMLEYLDGVVWHSRATCGHCIQVKGYTSNDEEDKVTVLQYGPSSGWSRCALPGPARMRGQEGRWQRSGQARPNAHGGGGSEMAAIGDREMG